MFKNLKPLLFFIMFSIIFFLLILIIFQFSISKSLLYYSQLYIYFNILFATLYFYLNRDNNFLSIFLVSIFSLLLTLLLCEVIYPTVLKENIILPLIENNKRIDKQINDSTDLVINIPADNLEKAKFYLKNEEYCSVWIYADKVLELDHKNLEALDLKKQANIGLKQAVNDENNIKYIQTLKYKKLVNQNRYIDAYYFIQANMNYSEYDQDFTIKLTNCYNILRDDYYSINDVQKSLEKPGYSDIKFYSTDGNIKLFKIEKMVEDDKGYYLQNVQINDIFYPYLYINKDSKIFASGFQEDFRNVYDFVTPVIPIEPQNLKLFSKELYTLSTSSLHFNIKIFRLKNIKYFKDSTLSNLLLSRLTSYLSVLIIFFMTPFGIKNRYYLNYLFNFTIILFLFKWIIKKMGLIFLFLGVGPSVIIVIFCYLLWLFILIKKFNPLHARS